MNFLEKKLITEKKYPKPLPLYTVRTFRTTSHPGLILLQATVSCCSHRPNASQQNTNNSPKNKPMKF